MRGQTAYEKVFEPLGENERKDYWADFKQELTDETGTQVDTIATFDVFVEPDDGALTIDGKQIQGTKVGWFASTPQPPRLYRLVAQVATTEGRVYTKVFGHPSQVDIG